MCTDSQYSRHMLSVGRALVEEAWVAWEWRHASAGPLSSLQPDQCPEKKPVEHQRSTHPACGDRDAGHCTSMPRQLLGCQTPLRGAASCLDSQGGHHPVMWPHRTHQALTPEGDCMSRLDWSSPPGRAWSGQPGGRQESWLSVSTHRRGLWWSRR
eukprot:1372946-Amphidinium_carterae.2